MNIGPGNIEIVGADQISKRWANWIKTMQPPFLFLKKATSMGTLADLKVATKGNVNTIIRSLRPDYEAGEMPEPAKLAYENLVNAYNEALTRIAQIESSPEITKEQKQRGAASQANTSPSEEEEETSFLPYILIGGGLITAAVLLT